MSAPPLAWIARGFDFCEAPRVDADGLVGFSDLTGGGYHRVGRDGRVETLLADRRWIGGAVLDEDGAVLVSGEGGLALVANGAARPLLSRIDDEPIVAINDIEADRSGAVYGGTVDFGAVLERGETPSGGKLFRLEPEGAVRILRDDVVVSNGLGFSPDRPLLYHSESTVGVWAWRLDEDGVPAGRPDLFVAADDCDGLAVDVEGGVWVAFWRQALLRRYRPDAVIDREIVLPVPHVVSLAFGGAALTDLYVTVGGPAGAGQGGVVRIDAPVPGTPTFRSRFAKEPVDGP